MKKQFIFPEAEVFGVKRNNVIQTSGVENGSAIENKTPYNDNAANEGAPMRMENLLGTPADEVEE